MALLMITLAGAAAAGEARRKVILDDDGFGTAQWMVIKSPDIEVLGMAAVTGDFWRDEAMARGLRGLEIIGRSDIPVLPGATNPLLNSEKLTDRWEALYGKLVWKGAWMKRWVEPTEQSLPKYHTPEVVPNLPQGTPTTKPSAEIAALFMIRKVHEFPGEVSIVATGPLTNLALAQRLDPQFAALAKELVYMGGSLNPQQRRSGTTAAQFAREFVNSPRREFNIHFDPEAARIVFHAPWKKIVMVPVDPATETEMSPELVRRLSRGNTLLAGLIRMEQGFPLWDQIAAAVWLDPSLIKDSAQLYVDVDTTFGPDYGNTLTWSPGYQPDLDEQLQTAVRAVDVPRLEAMMATLLTAR